MLGGIGKDAGATAAHELRETVKEAIPAAEQAVKGVEDHEVYGLYGLVADFANRLNGAECPVDLTLTATVRLTGKIGALKLSVPDYDVK
jgi:hypothetical protein